VAALLVYFGWRRTETQAEHLGIDASLLDTSLRTYLLGSVGPVFVLLLAVSVAGLLAVAMDRHLVPLVRAGERRGVVVLGLLRHAWMILPALVWSLGYVWRAQSYVLLPASIGGGVALTLYATELRQLAGPLDERERRRTVTARQAGALLAGITLFWTASNYAQVLGTRQAEAFAEGIHGLPEVVVHSSQRLHLSGPGVTEARLPDEGGAARYRYDGLRLAGQSGGKLYLVLDGWTMADGDFVVVRDDQVARLDLRR
jgi:hypothetical protein